MIFPIGETELIKEVYCIKRFIDTQFFLIGLPPLWVPSLRPTTTKFSFQLNMKYIYTVYIDMNVKAEPCQMFHLEYQNNKMLVTNNRFNSYPPSNQA